jgi:hypothetical protein
MKNGLNPGWIKEGKFTDMINEYTIEASRYINPVGEVGWRVGSWRERCPTHEMLVSGEKFYQVNFQIPEFQASHHTIEILGEINSVDPKEREAILEAIKGWEKQIVETAGGPIISPKNHPES